MFRGLQFGERVLYLPPGKEDPSLKILNCGYSRETGRAYRWHGMKRGPKGVCLFQYTIAGCGTLRYGRHHHLVQAQQAMLVRFPQDHEYAISDPEAGWEFIYIVLSGREVWRLWQHLERRYGPVVTLKKDNPTIEAAVRIVQEVFRGTQIGRFASARLAAELAFTLADEVSGPRDPAGGRFSALKVWCRNQLEKGITVGQMAAKAGLSRHHFAREFRSAEGSSPHGFLEWIRIETACRLLGQTELSIKEVSYASGFSRPDYFAKAFRKVMHTTPLAFRRTRIH